MLGVAAVMISLELMVFVTLNIQSWILVSMGVGSGREIVVTRKQN
ncbi:hypothetical protein OIU77_022798 [Salix suchowensis]|uniref:Uncharacterized protein n=1 Tax=Salix suchowensis TaxID=1278906 RepID=A0ABQ9C1L9_9ROSI|nr:hypothetical protein OIU77_022798 [Salix suchowensis]